MDRRHFLKIASALGIVQDGITNEAVAEAYAADLVEEATRPAPPPEDEIAPDWGLMAGAYMRARGISGRFPLVDVEVSTEWVEINSPGDWARFAPSGVLLCRMSIPEGKGRGHARPGSVIQFINRENLGRALDFRLVFHGGGEFRFSGIVTSYEGGATYPPPDSDHVVASLLVQISGKIEARQ